MLPVEFFPDRELTCRCGCGLLPPRESVLRLYAVRAIVGVPMPITSAARCKAHNRACGGKQGSVHLPADQRRGTNALARGQAWDILAKPELQARILSAAILCGFTGFGFDDSFIHIDDANRQQITYWRY